MTTRHMPKEMLERTPARPQAFRFDRTGELMRDMERIINRIAASTYRERVALRIWCGVYSRKGNGCVEDKLERALFRRLSKALESLE